MKFFTTRNHRCGFAIAASRRAQEINRRKDAWLWSAAATFCSDVRRGAFPTPENFRDDGPKTIIPKAWKTPTNTWRIIKTSRVGMPFTRKTFIKMGWQVPLQPLPVIPVGREPWTLWIRCCRHEWMPACTAARMTENAEEIKSQWQHAFPGFPRIKGQRHD